MGGAILNTERIEDFPAFPEGVPGFDFGPRLQEQAAGAGATVEPAEVTANRAPRRRLARGDRLAGAHRRRGDRRHRDEAAQARRSARGRARGQGAQPLRELRRPALPRPDGRDGRRRRLGAPGDARARGPRRPGRARRLRGGVQRAGDLRPARARERATSRSGTGRWSRRSSATAASRACGSATSPAASRPRWRSRPSSSTSGASRTPSCSTASSRSTRTRRVATDAWMRTELPGPVRRRRRPRRLGRPGGHRRRRRRDRGDRRAPVPARPLS